MMNSPCDAAKPKAWRWRPERALEPSVDHGTDARFVWLRMGGVLGRAAREACEDVGLVEPEKGPRASDGGAIEIVRGVKDEDASEYGIGPHVQRHASGLAGGCTCECNRAPFDSGAHVLHPSGDWRRDASTDEGGAVVARPIDRPLRHLRARARSNRWRCDLAREPSGRCVSVNVGTERSEREECRDHGRWVSAGPRARRGRLRPHHEAR